VRLFVALQIPASVREKLTELLREMKAIAPKVKWVRPENLHVTLKFIGHIAPEKLDVIDAALRTVRSEAVVTIEFNGMGFFPSEKRAQVLWAGAEPSRNLREVAGDVDQALTIVGFAAETREFKPHLTLARLDPPGMPPALAKVVERNAARAFGTLRSGTFHLIQSKLKPSGAEYTTLRSFPFAAEA
jgi:RNA 2',3'-cyclic 3'-phosphodiesterase